MGNHLDLKNFLLTMFDGAVPLPSFGSRAGYRKPEWIDRGEWVGGEAG